MAQKPMPSALLGWYPQSPSNGMSSLSMNAALNRVALGFMLPEAKTLSKLKWRLSNAAGTLGAGDLVCDIYSSTSGQPNASLASSSTVTSTPTAGQSVWVEQTGFSLALSANTQYWAVIRNANGTPASNNFTCAFLGTSLLPTVIGSGSGRNGWAKWHSTDGGTTWGTGVSGGSNVRLEFSDGTFAGFPLQSVATNTTQMVYSAREYGVRLVSPVNARLNVRGIAMFLTSVAGTPSADPYFKLYTGSTPSLLASTGTIPRGAIQAGAGWFYSYFTSTLTVEPNTVLRVTLAESANADTSANAFRFTEYTVEDDANSKLLMPTGSLQRAYYDGSNWTDTDTAFPAFALILDSDYEFAALASGNRPGRRMKWGC